MTITALIRSAWADYRRLPVLNEAALWLIALPSFGIAVAERLGGLSGDPYWPGYATPEGVHLPLFALMVLLNVFIIWGMAVVVVATRDHAKAHSFSKLRVVAAPLILPLLLTEILRLCLTFLWTLALIVPGLIYSIRTMLIEPIVVQENIAFRPALNRSIALVKGRTTEVAWLLIGSSLLIFMPIGISMGIVEAIVVEADPRFLAISDALQSAVGAVASVVYILVLVAVYRHLKAHPH